MVFYFQNILQRYLSSSLSLSNVREDVNIENILAQPVSPIPLSLFHEDGTMRKTCKSDLLHFFRRMSHQSSVLEMLTYFERCS